jgi:nicotinate dehydrogenase subunit B
VADYQLVGQPVARADIPAKATGQWTYVHDVRLPDMLHGRVVRPPYAGLDSGDFVGTSLLGIDETSIAAIAGVRSVVRINDFIGVIAEREEQAVAAAETLVVQWRPGPRLPDLEDLATTLTHGPSSRRILVERGEVDARLAGSAQRLSGPIRCMPRSARAAPSPTGGTAA